MNPTALLIRVGRTIRERNLFSSGDTVIVALSGGADSCALLDILVNLTDPSSRLVVAHLNHSLRGSASAADEEFTRALAESYALPYETRCLDVHAYALEKRLNLEDAGRRARIQFLDEIRQKWQANAVALAHHADDQAETVLMRLLRGSGATGLSGMSYCTGHGRIRPLLDITRADIESYLSARGLSHREDASNLDTMFLRNRIRHELLPLLELYNPKVGERLCATASLLAAEDDLLKTIAQERGARICTIDGESVICDLTQLAEEPQALQRRIFRQALAVLAGALDHFTNRHVIALEHLVSGPRPNATLNLPQGVTAVREYSRLILRRTPPESEYQLDLTIRGPGCYPLPGGDSLTVSLDAAHSDISLQTSSTACFDPDRVPFPWHVRTFRSGDRMTPLGMTGSKKLKEIFIDDKIPATRRRRIPLIFSGQTLIWACGVRVSQQARISAASSHVTTVQYCTE